MKIETYTCDWCGEKIPDDQEVQEFLLPRLHLKEEICLTCLDHAENVLKKVRAERLTLRGAQSELPPKEEPTP